MLVWSGIVDGRFACRVVRNGGTGGILSVHDGDNKIYAKPVSLSYGARFGPDASDVEDWQERCTEVIDERLKEEQQRREQR
jgi:hypothetical protein